jgi:hypothetical protein
MSTNSTTLQRSLVVVEEKVGPKTREAMVVLSQWGCGPGAVLPEAPEDRVVLAREDALSLARWIMERFSQ